MEGVVEARLVSDNSSEDSSDKPNTVRSILGPAAKVYSFPDFLREYVPSLDVVSILDAETPMSPSEHHQLAQMRVAPLESLKPLSKVCKPARRDESLSSLVDDVVWSLVQRRERQRRLKGDGRNQLSLGYAVASYFQSAAAQSCTNMPAGVIMMHLNTNVDFCKTSSLCRLIHRMVGDDVMRTLLMHTSMFVPVENDLSQPRGNFFQLTGPPLQGMSTRNTETSTNGKSRKRKRRSQRPDDSAKSGAPKNLNPHDTISRRSLFYSNSYMPAVGLPASHILSGPIRPKALLADMVEMNSGSERARRRRRKRLRETGELLCDEIFRRHRACDYNRLLGHYCPLPDCCQREESELPDFATSHTPCHQVLSFLSAVLSQVFPPNFWGSPANYDHFLSHHVGAFVRLRRQEQLANKTLLDGIRVTKISWLFGDQKGKISRTNHEAGEVLLLRVLRWVFNDFIIPLLRTTFYVTESEFSGKQTLYYRKPVWSTFRSLSMQKLLKKQYTEINEEEATKRLKTQQMGFSRLRLLPKATGVRPIATLCKREILHFPFRTRMEGALPIAYSETQSDEEIETPFGLARKKRKLNPSTKNSNTPVLITSSSERYIASMSTNSVLADTFAVLSYEHSKKEDTYGAGLPGLSHLYSRYRRSVEKHRPREPGAKKMYFGSVDIRHCYDNIDQEHLLTIVSGLLTEDDYLIQRYSVLHPFESMGRIVKRKKKQVGPPETFVPFSRTAVELAGRYHRTIFVDGVACTLVKKEQLMEQLREHLTSHLVTTRGRYGDRYLVQSTGIPQGSVLSSMLCNYYYANVESKLLSEHFKDSTTTLREEDDFLVRMVDDYMLVTSDLERLSAFLKKMKRGDESLGVHINEEKTKVSVDVVVENDEGLAVIQKANATTQTEFFPWCGLLFDIRTGEVRIDYTRFFDGKANDGLTVDRLGREGEILMAQMKMFVRPRCLPILFDPVINSRKVQVLNFTQLIVIGAIKVAEYLRTCDRLGTTTTNTPFILTCIESTILFAYDLINERLQASQCVANMSIKQSVAVWLGWRAFHVVFRELAQFTELSSCISKKASASNECGSSLEKTVSSALREIQLERLLDKCVCAEKGVDKRW
jgi:hypothetical protein